MWLVRSPLKSQELSAMLELSIIGLRSRHQSNLCRNARDRAYVSTWQSKRWFGFSVFERFPVTGPCIPGGILYVVYGGQDILVVGLLAKISI
jgi:hypothetical protein